MRIFLRRVSLFAGSGTGKAMLALGLTLAALVAGGADSGSGP